jgi:hypothetical protein
MLDFIMFVHVARYLYIDKTPIEYAASWTTTDICAVLNQAVLKQLKIIIPTEHI